MELRCARSRGLKNFSTFIQVILPWMFYASACALIFHMLYFGVEPYDEAFYILLPYHLALGGKSFLNELHTAQTAGLFLYPFVKIFYAVKGNTEGIILFGRYLYTAVTLAFSVGLYYLLRPVIAKPALLLIITTAFLFVPFNIHALSYNSLTIVFLTLCLLLHFYLATQNRARGLLFLAALLLAFTVIAYPTLIFLAPIIIAIFWMYMRKQYQAHEVYIYLAGLAVGGLWFAYVFLHVGMHQIHVFFQYLHEINQSGEAGSVRKFFVVSKQIFLSLPHLKILGILAIVTVILNAVKGSLELAANVIRARFVALVSLMLLLLLFLTIRTASAMLYVRYLAVVAPWLLLLANQSPYNKPLFVFVCIPAYLAGILSAWSSSNGIYNAAIGFFPAALVALMGAFWVIQKAGTLLKWPAVLTYILSIAFLGWAIYPFAKSLTLNNYADANTAQLTACMPSGIYAGIYTTPAKKAYYLQLAADLQAYRKNAQSILIFDDFPAGYLMTNLHPDANTLWTYTRHRCPTCNRQATVDYLHNFTKPDMIVQILAVAESPNPEAFDYFYAKNDPLTELLKEYPLVLERPGYKIYTLGQ